MTQQPEYPKWLVIAASHYHYRDCDKFEDGSFGSFRITHRQFIRELARAYERGANSDLSTDEFVVREEWRKRQEQVA